MCMRVAGRRDTGRTYLWACSDKMWSEEIISISLVTARNNTAYSLQSDSALGQEGLWSHYIMDFILVV